MARKNNSKNVQSAVGIWPNEVEEENFTPPLAITFVGNKHAATVEAEIEEALSTRKGSRKSTKTSQPKVEKTNSNKENTNVATKTNSKTLSAGEVAEQLKIDAKTLRRFFRQLGVSKNEETNRYEFTAAQAKSIVAKVSKAIEAEKSEKLAASKGKK